MGSGRTVTTLASARPARPIANTRCPLTANPRHPLDLFAATRNAVRRRIATARHQGTKSPPQTPSGKEEYDVRACSLFELRERQLIDEDEYRIEMEKLAADE
jgi:hypothetical protein